MAPQRTDQNSKFFHEEMSTIDVRDIWESDTETDARTEADDHPPPRVGGSAAEVKFVADHVPFEITLDL